MQAAGDGTLDFAAPDNGPETLTVNGLRSALAIAIQGLRKLSTFYPLTGESRSRYVGDQFSFHLFRNFGDETNGVVSIVHGQGVLAKRLPFTVRRRHTLL